MVTVIVQCADGNAQVLDWQYLILKQQRANQRRVVTTDPPGSSCFDGTREELAGLVEVLTIASRGI